MSTKTNKNQQNSTNCQHESAIIGINHSPCPQVRYFTSSCKLEETEQDIINRLLFLRADYTRIKVSPQTRKCDLPINHCKQVRYCELVNGFHYTHSQVEKNHKFT